jgi:hypothetical protein
MATIDLTGDDDDCQAGRRGKRRSMGKELAAGEGQTGEVIVIPDDGEERREACGGHDHKKTSNKSNKGIKDMALENNFQGEVLYVREVSTQVTKLLHIVNCCVDRRCGQPSAGRKSSMRPQRGTGSTAPGASWRSTR